MTYNASTLPLCLRQTTWTNTRMTTTVMMMMMMMIIIIIHSNRSGIMFYSNPVSICSSLRCAVARSPTGECLIPEVDVTLASAAKPRIACSSGCYHRGALACNRTADFIWRQSDSESAANIYTARMRTNEGTGKGFDMQTWPKHNGQCQFHGRFEQPLACSNRSDYGSL